MARAFAVQQGSAVEEGREMKLPKLPKANAVIQTGLGQTVMFSANQYTEAQMLQFQRDTVEACAKLVEEHFDEMEPWMTPNDIRGMK